MSETDEDEFQSADEGEDDIPESSKKNKQQNSRDDQNRTIKKNQSADEEEKSDALPQNTDSDNVDFELGDKQQHSRDNHTIEKSQSTILEEENCESHSQNTDKVDFTVGNKQQNAKCKDRPKSINQNHTMEKNQSAAESHTKNTDDVNVDFELGDQLSRDDQNHTIEKSQPTILEEPESHSQNTEKVDVALAVENIQQNSKGKDNQSHDTMVLEENKSAVLEKENYETESHLQNIDKVEVELKVKDDMGTTCLMQHAGDDSCQPPKKEESSQDHDDNHLNNSRSSLTDVEVRNASTDIASGSGELNSKSACDRNEITEDNINRSEISSGNNESKNTGGWGWGAWDNMVSKATSSVSNFLENVETTLGIPDPKDVAKDVKEEEVQSDNVQKEGNDEQQSKDVTKDVKEEDIQSDNLRKEGKIEQQPEETSTKKETSVVVASGGFGSWFSGFGVSAISNIVQNTSKDIMSGGIDALEYIGKKTIDVLSEGDPGLKKKRGIFSGSDKQPTLSQILRETKNKEDGELTENRITSFYLEFENFQGLAHLEALEILSNESEAKLNRILSAQSAEACGDSKTLLISVKDNFQLNDELEESTEDMEPNLSAAVENMSLKLKIDKLLLTEARLKEIITMLTEDNETNDKKESPTEIYSKGITGFAELTARSVEMFRKTGELLLLQDVRAIEKANDRAKSLRIIAELMKGYLSWLSSKYAELLNTKTGGDGDSKDTYGASKLITDIYHEGSNSATYIEDSHRLLLPILQLSAIK